MEINLAINSCGKTVASLGFIENHSLTVFYWNKENNTVRYQYNSEIEENTYYKNMCQKVFFEGTEQLEEKNNS